MSMPKILKLDSHGHPVEWIEWEKAVYYYATQSVLWGLGEPAFIARGGHNRVTGQQSVITPASIIAVRGDNKSKYRKRSLNVGDNKDLYDRDRYTCAYCGHKFPGNKLSKDHIIPRVQGGKDTWTNLVTSCKPCNQKKADRTPQEAGMELLYVPYIPSKAEHLILSNRHILIDQMEFLLSFVSDDSPLKKELQGNHPHLVQ
jgi:hypothetical protein